MVLGSVWLGRIMSDILSLPSISNVLFGSEYELIPSVNEVFELEMAYLERKALDKESLVERSAYFKSVDGKLTRHFLLCSAHANVVHKDGSPMSRAYFSNGKFSTGYCTHGLFPYRGKFHPQLVRGLLNIMGVRQGETLMDPMCGSGTANIEAALMGIDSFAIDVSPFCQLMTRVKYDAMTVDTDTLLAINGKANELFDFFTAGDISKRVARIKSAEKIKVYEICLLAFLDAMGYARRVSQGTHRDLFAKVLSRYLRTIADLHSNAHFKDLRIGRVEVIREGDTFDLPIKDASVDGVITSPPYSFAIDYAKNDEPQLLYLDCDVGALRSRMIGLRGQRKSEKLEIYFKDMERVCYEISRVLKTGKYLALIIGSNTNQTGGIRLEGRVIQSCEKNGLRLVKSILKPIRGMRNTMKEEYILLFQKYDE